MLPLRITYPINLLYLLPTRPGHKSLSWLNPVDKKRVICQLHTEMINFSGWNLAADEEEDNDSEPPAKKPALISEEDDFDLLFGQKEDTEAEGQEQSDDHLQHLQDELDRYLKETEINFRKRYFPLQRISFRRKGGAHLILIKGWGNVSFSGKMRNCLNFNFMRYLNVCLFLVR